MTTAYSRPIPAPDIDTQGFWDGCKAHELRIQRCNACGTYIHSPAPICHNCNAMDTSWAKVSGRGSVFTFIVVHAPNLPGWADHAPYTVAWIELDEQAGLKMISNVVECDPKDVQIGMPVEVVFEDADDEISIPRFKPLR